MSYTVTFGLVIDHKILRTGSQSHKNQVTTKKEKSSYHKQGVREGWCTLKVNSSPSHLTDLHKIL